MVPSAKEMGFFIVLESRYKVKSVLSATQCVKVNSEVAQCMEYRPIITITDKTSFSLALSSISAIILLGRNLAIRKYFDTTNPLIPVLYSKKRSVIGTTYSDMLKIRANLLPFQLSYHDAVRIH